MVVGGGGGESYEWVGYYCYCYYGSRCRREGSYICIAGKLNMLA